MTHEFVAQLRAELERFTRERDRLTGVIEPLERLIELYQPSGKKAASETPSSASNEKKPRRLTPQHVKSQKRVRATIDWSRAEQMDGKGKSVREIAAALGVSDAAVYYQRSRWRGKSTPATSQAAMRPRLRAPKADRKRIGTGIPGSLSGKPRQAIKLQQCPHCAAMTTLNPCERCHTLIAGTTAA